MIFLSVRIVLVPKSVPFEHKDPIVFGLWNLACQDCEILTAYLLKGEMQIAQYSNYDTSRMSILSYD